MYFHCELVFIKDFVADSLILSSKSENGYPEIVPGRIFNKYKRPVNVHWYKFVGLSAEKELEVRRAAERLIASKEYRMNMFTMVSSALPSFVLKFKEWFLGAYYQFNRLGDVEGILEYDDPNCKHTFCSQFIGLVLNESKVFAPGKDLCTDGNIQDLIVQLTRLARIEKINSSDIYLRDHHTTFVRTEVDHRALADPDLQVTKDKIQRADDYF